MKLIALSKGLSAKVDDDDFASLSQWSWYALDTGSGIYAARDRRVSEVTGPIVIRMHRVILGARSSQIVDHRNGDTLDNTRTNLRICSENENRRNRRKSANCSSSFKGVCWHRSAGKWVAYCKSGGVKHYLGFFEKEEDAARAYNLMAVQLHGEFARLNEVKV